MKKAFQIFFLPFYWLWKCLSSGLAVLTNLIFLSLLLAILVMLFYTPKVTIPDNAALILALEGDIVEERSPMDPMTKIFNNLAGEPLHEEVFLQDIIDTIYTAADDQRIEVERVHPAELLRQRRGQPLQRTRPGTGGMQQQRMTGRRRYRGILRGHQSAGRRGRAFFQVVCCCLSYVCGAHRMAAKDTFEKAG